LPDSGVNQVTFYHIGDLSGPYRPISQPLLAGFTDAMAYFNSEEGGGGLCGAEIVMKYEDTGGDGAKAQEFWTDFNSIEGPDRPKMIFLYSSADAELLRQDAADKQMPILLAAGSEKGLYGEDQQAGWVFAVIPTYADQLGLFCDYIANNWSTLGIEGDPVIGHLSWNIAFGQSSDTAETRAYCESKDIGYAGAEYFLPIGTPDLSGQLKKLTDAGANIIYTTSLATGSTQVVRAVVGADLLGKVIIGGTNWILDTSVYGLGGPDTNGIIGTLPYLWWDQLDNPGVQIINNSWVQNRLSKATTDEERASAFLVRNIAYLASFAVIDTWIEAMTRAINEVGYDNLSGEAVYNVFDNDFEYEALQGVLTIAFDANTRSQRQAYIGQIQFVERDGQVQPTIAPITELLPMPDLRVGGADVPQ
jgi:ABC-type branched-subunit amino acid transport system substrate-binding protein